MAFRGLNQTRIEQRRHSHGFVGGCQVMDHSTHRYVMATTVVRQTAILLLLILAVSSRSSAQRHYSSAFNINGLAILVTVSRIDSNLTCSIAVRNGSTSPLYIIDLPEWRFDRDYWCWRDDRYIVDGRFDEPVPSSGWRIRRLNPRDTCSALFSGVRYLWPDTSIVRVVVDVLNNPDDVKFVDQERSSNATPDRPNDNTVWIPRRLLDRFSPSTFEARVGLCRDCIDVNTFYPR